MRFLCLLPAKFHKKLWLKRGMRCSAASTHKTLWLKPRNNPCLNPRRINSCTSWKEEALNLASTAGCTQPGSLDLSTPPRMLQCRKFRWPYPWGL